ncbi:MAG TPA: NUDIX domain-containing protein [Anaerolineales bacterium]|nr:NUDIX domain-containing protein [Anaerolineales bacterium]
MTDDHIYFRWLAENRQIRASARAIIIDKSTDRFLVENNHGAQDQYLNFIGGGVELGESLESCLEREIREETNAKVIRMDYLFVVENFITFKGDITHGLEHYFEVELDREEVKSDTDGIDFKWFSSDDLADVDLRPHVVRDHIVKRTYQSVRHLISNDNVA